MPTAPPPLLTDLLKQVSRSFYLTLRVLPGAVRPQIGLAYLLARTTDTIADTPLLPVTDRLQSLRALGEHIAGRATGSLSFTTIARHQPNSSERTLLERVPESLALLAATPEDDRQLIRKVLATILSGQSLDLERFANGNENHVLALATADELDDYTYRVAGCVGEFWTEVCLAHLFPRPAAEERFLREHGVRFGQGLQLVNILRDLPGDLRQGRCYVPTESLSAAGLRPADLLDPTCEPRFRTVYDPLVALAEAHLRAGWAYTNALPRTATRVRLACAWPVLIGLETLRLLRAQPVLSPDSRVKISRRRVYGIMAKSLVSHPFPRAWHRQVEAIN